MQQHEKHMLSRVKWSRGSFHVCGMTNSGCKVVVSFALNCVGVTRPKPITPLCSMQFADSDFHTRL